jgi:hypothetical protein
MSAENLPMENQLIDVPNAIMMFVKTAYFKKKIEISPINIFFLYKKLIHKINDFGSNLNFIN